MTKSIRQRGLNKLPYKILALISDLSKENVRRIPAPGVGLWSCYLLRYANSPYPGPSDQEMRRNETIVLSLVQICFGVSAITAQIILILNDEDNGVVRYLVAGLWRGVFVGINGILGIAGGNKLISKMTKSFLLFSVISIISCVSLFVISIAEATSLSTANPDIDVGTVYGLNIFKALIAFMMGILSVATTILATKILGSQAAPV